MSPQGDLFEAAGPIDSGPTDSGPSVAGGAAVEASDSGDRRLASTCFDRPIMLEAGAGTGKTATLVARIVHWCMGTGWSDHADPAAPPEVAASVVLRRIAAITFTEAAAVEMSNRVSQALAWFQEATAGGAMPGVDELPPGFLADALPADPSVLNQRAEALRGALDQLNVSTIHAFCRRLLSAHPLEVGLDPSFEVDADASRVRIVVRVVLEEFLREAWAGAGDERLVALARQRVNPGDLEEALLALLKGGARAADLELDPLRPEVCDPLVAALELAVRGLRPPAFEGHESLGGLAKNATAHSVLAALEATAAALAEPSELAALCEQLNEAWEKKAWERLKKWAEGDFDGREGKALGPEGTDRLRVQAEQLREALGPLRGLDLVLLGLARPLLAELLERIEQELRRRGIATFTDLLALAQELLENSPAAARAERRRLSQLLVDEFQDTDSVQCAVVQQLALEGEPEERPGLFLVGDPKQSIFAWRSADLGAYDAFAKRIEAAGGVRLKLTRNFRSRAAILDEVERAVAPVMEQEDDVQPEFIPLEPGRKGAHEPGPGPAVEYWVSWPVGPEGVVQPEAGKPILESYRCEARAIAADVRATRAAAQDRTWRSFAILFRGMSQVEPYLDSLRQLGIPYQVKSDRKYYQRREVVDAAALVGAVLDPSDMIALVALLRSPMVGTPDAALPLLWAEGLPGILLRLTGDEPGLREELSAVVRSAAARLPAELPGHAGIEGWEQSLELALHSLADLRACYHRLPIDAWIERLCGLFLPEVVESARFLGGWRVANLERFFRELEASLEERSGDHHAVLRTLRANLAGDDRGDSSPAADSGVDAVQILTIHGAKGLEFDTVYLAQTHMGKKGGGPSAKTEFARHQGGVSYKLLGAPEPGWYTDQKRRDLAGQAERVRLLYVALTRAEQRLVVLGGFPEEVKRKDWRDAYTFSDLLESRPGMEKHLGELAGTLETDGPSSALDEHGVRWLVPATSELAPELQPAGGSEPGDPRAVETLVRASERLRADRGDARVRMEQPFQVAASGLGHAPLSTGSEPTGGLGQGAAMAVGTALHRVLELAELGGDPSAELARWRPQMGGLLAPGVDASDLGPALERAEQLLEGLGENGLLARLLELGDHVLARELAVLLPAGGADGGAGPVGYVSGTIDLLYRDPATGAVVVADYKTDLVEGEAELRERADAYRAQGQVYVRAVREALGLDADPRFELWFLHVGEVVRV